MPLAMASTRMSIVSPERANVASSLPGTCAHCGSPTPEGAPSPAYCCAGCEAVAALLRSEELTRYYAIAGDDVLPVGTAPAPRSHAWLEPLLDAQSEEAVSTLELDV